LSVHRAIVDSMTTTKSIRKGSTIAMTATDSSLWRGDIVHEDERGVTIDADGKTMFFPWTSVLKVQIESTPEPKVRVGQIR
jgi:hypothetical protein